MHKRQKYESNNIQHTQIYGNHKSKVRQVYGVTPFIRISRVLTELKDWTFIVEWATVDNQGQRSMFGGIHTNLYGKIKDYNEIRGKTNSKPMYSGTKSNVYVCAKNV